MTFHRRSTCWSAESVPLKNAPLMKPTSLLPSIMTPSGLLSVKSTGHLHSHQTFLCRIGGGPSTPSTINLSHAQTPPFHFPLDENIKNPDNFSIYSPPNHTHF